MLPHAEIDNGAGRYLHANIGKAVLQRCSTQQQQIFAARNVDETGRVLRVDDFRKRISRGHKIRKAVIGRSRDDDLALVRRAQDE
jgi:hypothetical protein